MIFGVISYAQAAGAVLLLGIVVIALAGRRRELVSDAVFALWALVGMGAFLYVIPKVMREVSYPLIGIFALVIGMAVFDFLRTLAKSRGDGGS
ncbi:MAG: hypothetical protein AAF577_15785 [Pseudomonadota bacterium]